VTYLQVNHTLEAPILSTDKVTFDLAFDNSDETKSVA
jgi:hypothetical protein